MITHEIRKPSRIRRVFEGVFEFRREKEDVALKQQQTSLPVLIDARRIENDYEGGSARHTAIPFEDRVLAASYMGDKQAYNEYIRTVEQKFPKNMLVTSRNIPIVLGRTTPPIHFEVRDFQEIRHLASWDSTYKEPKVIGILACGPGNLPGYIFMCPSAIRPLTAEEQYLVNVSNLKIEKQDDQKAVAPLTGDEPQDSDRSCG